MQIGAFVPVDHVGHGIYIAGHRATAYARELQQAGLTHVLKLYADEPYFPAGFVVLDNAITDGEFIPPEMLKRGADFLMAQVNAGRPVLSMCGAGISRSATFVLAALVQLDYTLEEAFRLLKAQHPIASPHPALWTSLIEQYGLNYRVEEALDWCRD
jgi:protein-tyrosine phosphatase